MASVLFLYEQFYCIIYKCDCMIVLHCIVLYCFVLWHFIVLYCIIDLYCIVLYCNVNLMYKQM